MYHNDAVVPELSIAVNSMNRTGLLQLLEDTNQTLTVFVPSNLAIASLPVQPKYEDLPAILTYHVVQGHYTKEDLVPGVVLDTLQGSNITLTEFGTIKGADIVTFDILASNGVLHVIDTVLFPEVDDSLPQNIGK